MRFALIILLILVSACKSKTKEHSIQESEVEQIIVNFKLTETVKGITNFKLSASKAFVFSDYTNVNNLTLDFYKNGVPYATLIADSGVLFTTNNDMDAMGNVKVTGVEGAVLETNYLKWSSSREVIYTDSMVLITTKDKKITGKKFESNPDLTNIKLKEPFGSGETSEINTRERTNDTPTKENIKEDSTEVKQEIKTDSPDTTDTQIQKPRIRKLRGIK